LATPSCPSFRLLKCHLLPWRNANKPFTANHGLAQPSCIEAIFSSSASESESRSMASSSLCEPGFSSTNYCHTSANGQHRRRIESFDRDLSSETATARSKSSLCQCCRGVIFARGGRDTVASMLAVAIVVRVLWTRKTVDIGECHLVSAIRC